MHTLPVLKRYRVNVLVYTDTMADVPRNVIQCWVIAKLDNESLVRRIKQKCDVDSREDSVSEGVRMYWWRSQKEASRKDVDLEYSFTRIDKVEEEQTFTTVFSGQGSLNNLK